MRNLFSRSKTKKFFGWRWGPESQHGASEATGNSLTGFRAQSKENSDELRFQFCKARKILLTLSVYKQEGLPRFRAFFFLLFKFLVMHLLSLLTALLVMGKRNLPERKAERDREREGRAGRLGRETDRD